MLYLKCISQYIWILLTVCNNISIKNVIKHVKSVKLLNPKLLNVKSLKGKPMQI